MGNSFYSEAELALIRQHRKDAQQKAREAVKARGVKIDPRLVKRSSEQKD